MSTGSFISRPLAAAAVAALLSFGALAGEVFLFRGDQVYLVPRGLAKEMSNVAPRAEWKLFADHTRYIDIDGDGRNDVVAIALGAPGGYGAQVRYRLPDAAKVKEKLGRWSWCVLTDEKGRLLYTKHNL